MNISFECLQCEADFEFELPELLKDPSAVVCPNCNTKADATVIENAAAALDEFLGQMSRIKRKFRVAVGMEFEELADEVSEKYAEEEDEESLWGSEPDEEEDE